MADSPLLAIIEQLEEARLEFWDDDSMRAEAARFLLVAKAYAAVEQLPPRELLVALKNLRLDDSDLIEAARQQVSSLGGDDQAQTLRLACLDVDMQVHLLIGDAKSLSHTGHFFDAAQKYRKAEEARRAMEQRLQPAPDSEREVQHEWHDLATLYPNLTACMEEAYRDHATQTEPLQLAQAAITLAQVGDGAGAERALAIAARWTEGQGPILPILERLAGFLPRWPALQEAILRSSHDPIPALNQLTAWLNDPQRQMVSQLLSESASDGIGEVALRADLQRVVGDEWMAVSQADMQAVFALRLTIAIAQENLETLERACQQIRDSMKYLGATTTLRQQLSLLRAWQETRLAALKSSSTEIAPFVEEPAVIGSEVVQDLEARVQLHQSILKQIESLTGAVSPATDAHPEEAVTTGEATAALEEPVQGIELPAQPMPGASQSSGTTGAVEIRNALPGRNGAALADPLADVYRSLRGTRFSEAAEQLRVASSSPADDQDRARMARLAVVAQACLAALEDGSNPSSQTVEDLIQAAGYLEADSGLDAASTWLNWSNDACPVLDDSGVRMLRREIDVRRAFRSVNQLMAQARFSEAALRFPSASQENNGLNSASAGSDFWRSVAIDWTKTAEQKKRLISPINAQTKLQEAAMVAIERANSGVLDTALSRLAGPLNDAAALKEPLAHRTFHPLAFWMHRVLTAWRDVQAVEAASQPDQSLLVLQQARLTCDHARAVTQVADFGDSLESFNALIGKWDEVIHNKHEALRDNVLKQLKTALDQNASLAELDRLLSSVIACQRETSDQIPTALRQMAQDQEGRGDQKRGPAPHSIEELAGAAPFYQSARLLALFEAKDQSPSVASPGQSLAEKLAALAAKAQQIMALQADFDGARRDDDGVRAKELLIRAKSAGLKLKESGLVEDWDYVIESKQVLLAQGKRLTQLDDWINQLWSPANAAFADGE